ncbi:hypothetical protein [Elizabethkingia meningoseptica]|uniref:hypothetical protein n=1 Tax=Elizabethkingia meningoseptica TaxID=238 RepID=UPI0038916FA6
MILIMGGYFILYADDISVPFVLGFVLLFRFTLLIGIFVDIRKLSLGWKKLILMSGMGIILSVLMILNLNNTFLPLATFICLGISSLQLSGILRKIKKYQKHQQFPIL